MANTTAMDGEWRKITVDRSDVDARRLWIEIPTGFTEMQQQAPERALQWRLDVRQMFQRTSRRAIARSISSAAGGGLWPLSADAAKPARPAFQPGGQVIARPPSTCRWM